MNKAPSDPAILLSDSQYVKTAKLKEDPMLANASHDDNSGVIFAHQFTEPDGPPDQVDQQLNWQDNDAGRNSIVK